MFFDIRNWKNSVDRKEFNNTKSKVLKLIDKNNFKTKLYDLSFLHQDDKLLNKKISECYKLFNNFEKIILLGTGGSSLGSKAILDANLNDKIIFLENIDPSYVVKKLDKVTSHKILLLIISKSGETAEVLSLYSTLDTYFADSLNFKNNILIISDKKCSTLFQISKINNIKFIEHNPRIGGRFSCFSETGLIPMKLAGLNSRYIKSLSNRTFLECIHDKYSFSDNVALLSKIINNKKYKGHVVLSYQDSIQSMILWYRQLWGESLGKNRKGTHLMPAIGSIDQHSQLQMWLDGPNNLFYTIIIPRKRKKDFKIQDNNKLIPKYLEKKTLGNILYSMGIATYRELVKAKRPVRLILLDNDSIYPVVKLMSFFMLEVSILGKVIGINPFDQPAVEKVKVLTKKLLLKNG